MHGQPTESSNDQDHSQADENTIGSNAEAVARNRGLRKVTIVDN